MHTNLFRPRQHVSNPISIIISNLLLSFFIPLHYAKNDSVLYETCSETSTTPCGKPIKGKLDYPFWVEDIGSPDCGLEKFELSCEEYDLLVDMGSKNKYKVVEIDPTKTLLTLKHFHMPWNICVSSVQETKLNAELYDYGQNTEFLDFFYHCGHETIATGVKSNLGSNIKVATEVPCWHGKEQVYFLRNNSAEKEKFTKCSNTTLPISTKVLEELIRTRTQLQPHELFDGSFEVYYNKRINQNACMNCVKTGGLCWSGTDTDINDPCLYKQSGKGKNLGRIIGIASGVGIVGLILILLALFFCRRKKAKQVSYIVSRNISSSSFSMSDSEKGSGTYMGVTTFSYNELEKATNNFDSNSELGDGGFGTVYKGKLQDGREVAVKRLYENSIKRVEQFMNEIKILTQLRHPNLVVLYGSTSQQCRKLLLVYEYIPNGTIADHLYGENAERENLAWTTRMSIAIETASALSFLHASDVIHRDVKTTNILLDNNFHVKVADFGLSRLFPLDVTHVSTAPQGTPGYVDPEYHQCYQLTSKSDVYSFGVVLIELISSKPAVDITRHRHEINLANLAINKIQGDALHELVDPSLGFESDYEVRNMITEVAELAFRCLQNERELRPSMEEVYNSLKEIKSRNNGEKNELQDTLFRDDASLLKNYPQNRSPDSVTAKWVSSSISST